METSSTSSKYFNSWAVARRFCRIRPAKSTIRTPAVESTSTPRLARVHPTIFLCTFQVCQAMYRERTCQETIHCRSREHSSQLSCQSLHSSTCRPRQVVAAPWDSLASIRADRSERFWCENTIFCDRPCWPIWLNYIMEFAKIDHCWKR